LVNEFQLLTTKPVMYVCNVDEKSATTGNAYVEMVKAAVAHENAEVIFVTAAIEAEIASHGDGRGARDVPQGHRIG
jgi:ribosome-binding ATPase YchF (GTP1/OBG family)